MASQDHRYKGPRNPVVRAEASQIVIPNGGTTEVTTTLKVNMVIEQITVKVNDNDGNATMTVAIRDDNAATLWSEAAIAENATTVFRYSTLSDTDLPLKVLVNGTITIGATPSGDPGESTGTVDVVLYGR